MKAVNTEAGKPLDSIRIINLQVRFEIAPVFIAHRAVDQLLELGCIQCGQGQPPDIAIHTNHGRKP